MANGQVSSGDIEVFITYSHKDEALRNELENHLSILRRQGLISTWNDRKIGAGKEWKEQIDSHMNSAQVILLLVSSDFLASDYCYDIEMKRAIERHESGQARVIPVILRPVEWQDAPFGKLQALPTNAEPIVSKKWGSADEALVDVAKGIRNMVGSLNSTRDNDLNKTAVNKNPKVVVVDQMHRGDYATISDAISAAAPGSRILVRSGIYDEGLVIDKPLEIEGDGNLGEVVIRAEGKAVISFRTARGIVSNLVLEKMGGGEYNCVDIEQGALDLNRCDITSNSLACVAIHSKTYPKLKGNRIHDGKHVGIFINPNCQGTLEDNDIYRNADVGISIGEGSNPTIKHNKIYYSNGIGIVILDDGRGIIENNDIYGNKLAGVTIWKDGCPSIRRNKIHDGNEAGITVMENGQGIIEDNDIYGNNHYGIIISNGSCPTIKRNKIHEQVAPGIFIMEKGQGIIEDNDIYGNKLVHCNINLAN
jgi:parallel beta-helix repeat protein